MSKEKERLFRLVDGFSRKKIAIWGDFILDEYLYGITRRISREAPVLIISYQGNEFSLGGAGNSVLNLKALGAEPLPIGVVGTDAPGKKILQMLKQKGIPADYLIREKSHQTPIKTRILAGEASARKQQILRIDREGRVPERRDLKERMQNLLRSLQRTADAILISDYHYLTVTEDIFNLILPSLRKTDIPLTLDSRFRLLRFKGVTASTPNEPEVEGALGVEIADNEKLLREAGAELLRKTGAAAVLVTRGPKGMVLFEKNKPPFSIPIHGSTDIVDVTGAGDTVISVFTLALTCGATFKEAARLANFAASVVVMKKGTATLGPEELREAIVSRN